MTVKLHRKIMVTACSFMTLLSSQLGESTVSAFAPSVTALRSSAPHSEPTFATTLLSTETHGDTFGPAVSADTPGANAMPEPLPTTLRNDYYFLRHGQSTANVAGIISSARSLAYTDKHGLTQLGYQQGQDSAHQLYDLLRSSSSSSSKQSRTEQRTTPKQIIFITSPFARARQTAEACRDALRQLLDNDNDNDSDSDSSMFTLREEVQFDERLMERYFGNLDGEALYTYAYVWPMDRLDVTHTAFGVESVAAVCTRFRDFVLDTEARFDDSAIVMASHADVCQIAQLYAANAENVGEFSSYRFQNGEVRRMEATDASLPPAVPLEAPKRGTALYMEQMLAEEGRSTGE